MCYGVPSPRLEVLDRLSSCSLLRAGPKAQCQLPIRQALAPCPSTSDLFDNTGFPSPDKGAPSKPEPMKCMACLSVFRWLVWKQLIYTCMRSLSARHQEAQSAPEMARTAQGVRSVLLHIRTAAFLFLLSCCFVAVADSQEALQDLPWYALCSLQCIACCRLSAAS